MTGLVSNIPVLRAGFTSIVIDFRKRKEYIGILAEIQQKIPEPDSSAEYPEMERLVFSCIKEISECIEQAREFQDMRKNIFGRTEDHI